MAEGTPPERWPNRAHYLPAAAVGGGATALLSAIPVLNVLNVVFFCLVIAGGFIAVHRLTAKHGGVPMNEAALVGALSGGIGGAILGGLSLLAIAVVGTAAPHASTGEVLLVLGAASGASCVTALLIFPTFGAIGGVLGHLRWPPSAEQGAANEGEPSRTKPESPTTPTPEEATARRRLMRATLGTLSAFLVIVSVFCVFAGYLGLLQDRNPRDTAGEEPVAEGRVTLGETVRLEVPVSSYHRRGRYGVWLVGDGPLPRRMHALRGQMRCRNSDTSEIPANARWSNLRFYGRPDESEPRWFFLGSEYGYGWETLRCEVRIDQLPGAVSGSRIVITRLVRPSDWFQ